MRIVNFLQIFLLICGVFGVETNEEKTVPVMEGDSVTLNPDPAKIQGFNQIQWRFESGPVFAQIDGTQISYPHLTEILEGRLQLDQQTGSLTIKNMRNKHSGLYKLKISQNTGNSDMTFRVIVYESPAVIGAGKAEMKTVSEKEGESVTLQTDVTEPHGDELIVWRFGDEGKLIAKQDIEAKSPKLSILYDTDERFKDRLKLDEKTGSLTITHSKTAHSGVYTVKISSNKQTLYKTFSVIISAVPDPGLSSGVITGIVLLVVLAAAAAAVVMYFCYKRSELEKQIGSVETECKEGGCAVLQYYGIKKGVQLLWWRVSSKVSAIASMSENDKKTYWYDPRFRGRLQLDPQTGSLIIRNLKKTDAGEYHLEIKSREGTKYRKYEVILSGEVETVSVKEGDDVTLEFSEKRGDWINWEFEEESVLIASLKKKDNSKDNETRYPEGRFKDKLELNPQTGSLTIKKIRPEHTGLYTVKSNPENNFKKSFNVVFDDFTETSGNESEITGFMGRIQRFCGLARIGGAFGDEKDEMKTLSVMEGDDLNLNTETDIQTDDEIIVRFGTAFRERRPYVIIARFSKPDDARFSKPDNEFKSAVRRFKDRLQRNLTGPLTITITNFKTTDCGDYYVQITNKKKKSFKSFTFILVPSERGISVKEGKNVILDPETKIQKDDQIQWRFGDILIAKISGGTGETHDDVAGGIFRGRLKLDEKTGNLIITNMIIKHTGDYKLHISRSRGNTNMTFVVTVYKNTVFTDEGDSVTLKPDTEIQRDDLIEWTFMGSLIADIRGIISNDVLDGRFRDRLELDKKTKSLTITDTRNTDSGDYKLEIKSNSGVSYKTFSVVVIGLFLDTPPPPRPDQRKPDLSTLTSYQLAAVKDLVTVMMLPGNEDDLDAGNEEIKLRHAHQEIRHAHQCQSL